MNSQRHTLKTLVAAGSLGFALASGISTPQAAEDPSVINIKRLSLEMALKAAQAAIHDCRAKGIQIGVTVMDRSGINPDRGARQGAKAQSQLDATSPLDVVGAPA